jgi:hypothetical protein
MIWPFRSSPFLSFFLCSTFSFLDLENESLGLTVNPNRGEMDGLATPNLTSTANSD